MTALMLCASLNACAQTFQQAAKPVQAPPEAATPKPPPPPPRKLQLADLASFSPDKARSVFGTPSLERTEGEVLVLQFTSGSCVSDMVFNGGGALVHVETRAKSGTPIDIQPCLDTFEQTLPKPEPQPAAVSEAAAFSDS
ncbi:MAG: hypothetical protein AAF337_02745 [Pseudomonadota bacterium]